MIYQQLSDEFAVAAQISPGDITRIAADGFRTIICNRPDHEDAGQPTVAEIAAACEQHGMELHHVPVAGNSLEYDTVLRQLDVMTNAPGPVLAYCRSGNRSTIIWNVIQRMNRNVR